MLPPSGPGSCTEGFGKQSGGHLLTSVKFSGWMPDFCTKNLTGVGWEVRGDGGRNTGCFLPSCPTHLVPLILPALIALTSEP